MIRVRRHERQLPSGKSTSVRQHERQGVPRQEWADHEDGSWWDGSGEPAPPGASEHPEGTSYFRQDDDLFAVHPDGTVHPMSGGGDDGGDEPPAGGWSPEDEPEGTWYLREGDDIYAVHPDGTTRLVPPDEPEDAARSRELAEGWEFGDDGIAKLDGDRYQPSYEMVEEAHRMVSEDPELAKALHSAGPATHESRAFTRMKRGMRSWRSRPEPVPRPDKLMPSDLARALGCDTPEGREKYDRGRAYREAGYAGPLDSDNRIPDPDDPANHESLSALAALSEL